MRVKTIRISGYKAIPFCARILDEDQKSVRIDWSPDAFQLSLPTQKPFLATIIGPNSCGKSCILKAIDYFYSTKKNLSIDEFNEKKVNENSVIIEITFWGDIPSLDNWYKDNCVKNGEHYELTVANTWNIEGRTTYIRCESGNYLKVGTKDKNYISELIPQYRLIEANQNLCDEANPEKKNLVSDLVKEVLERGRNASSPSIVNFIRERLEQLNNLMDRDAPQDPLAWQEIETLEKLMSDGLKPITPGGPQVRLSVKNSIPTIENIFLKSRMRIDDGIELDIDNHGLGLQRSFLVSALRTWLQLIGHKQDNVDYLFAIEEPELYLHPHAIRVFLKTFKEIAEADQILFTSHSGEFVNHVPLENVFRIQRVGNRRSIIQPELSMVTKQEKEKIERYLLEDRSDMLFARSVILVEGQSELFALPGFAKILGYDLDECGVSVVFVNGAGNFETYHHILKAFGIPHIIFADGDGNREGKENKYRNLSDGAFVLDHDFEHLIAKTFSKERVLEVINLCRERNGKPKIGTLTEVDITPKNIASHWSEPLWEKIKADISPEHRKNYEERKKEIEELLFDTASNLVVSDYVNSSIVNRKLSERLKREGKPLVGRILGEIATPEEVRGMGIIEAVVERAVELAK